MKLWDRLKLSKSESEYKPEEMFQAMADNLIELHPLQYVVEVRMEPFSEEDGAEGEFFVETYEATEPGEVVDTTPKMIIQMDPFEDATREELLEMIHVHLFIHEMGHALQFRNDEYEESREEDHDAEWGIKYAQAYNAVVSRFNGFSVDEQNEILGLTDEKRDAIISELADTLTAFEEENDEQN